MANPLKQHMPSAGLYGKTSSTISVSFSLIFPTGNVLCSVNVGGIKWKI